MRQRLRPRIKRLLRHLVPACGLVAMVVLSPVGCSLGGRKEVRVVPFSGAVGRVAENTYVTPTGQWLTPAGRQVELPEMRPQTLAFSPDGKWFVTAGKKNKLVAVETATGKVLQEASLSIKKPKPLPSPPPPLATNVTRALPPKLVAVPRPRPRAKSPSASGQMSLTGLAFSPDGRRVYLSAVVGSVRVFPIGPSNRLGQPISFHVPKAGAPKDTNEVPAGLAVSADGSRLYVAGNLGNRLYELDAATGVPLRRWPTGVAPFDVVLVGGKAYVSNEGGRQPSTNDLVAPAGKGMTVRVDPVRHIASEGSVSVIDLATGTVKTEIMVGLHPTAMAVSPDWKYVVVANTGSDTLSVIDTRTDQVVEKIWARQTPADLFGAQPNALAFDPRGKRLFVCNGTQNAVAVVHFEPENNASSVVGLIPVGWFPGAVKLDPSGKTLCVANIKGLGALKAARSSAKAKLRTKDFHGAISLLPLPSDRELAGLTGLALRNMRYPALAESRLPARPGQPPRPVPERVGEPSFFKHVIYVIKENRSYDQVLGDMKEGNGDPRLCVFGETYTPNQHKIAREFVLLDNTYCSGVQSADGHQWTDSAIANSYVERQLTADYPRSYPGAKEQDAVDALAWASSGFIWDNALAHGKTFRNYGEWMISDADWVDKKKHKSKPAWQDFWKDYRTGGNQTRLACHPGIETLRKYSPTNTVGWDLNVPDVMRAATFIRELRQFEATGTFPDFVIIFLPNDHTGGTRGNSPSPGAQIADNDLAFGQIVEAVSHSQFWPETCLFAIEDDPQAGWDHVSGYRTTCYVVSPYTKRRLTVSTQYNQTSLVRTMELILGLPPMNQLDATATPMTDCFTNVPDLAPFVSLPNRFPFEHLNPEPRKIANRVLRRDAIVSERLPLRKMDCCPEDVLNGILWRAMKGPDEPFPTWAVKSVADLD